MASLRLGLPLLLIASTSFALPRPNSKVRAGANHHLGDDSYVANHGARPAKVRSELERDRMHEHLAFVRDWLATRPATRPELEKRRAEILGYFDAYIAKYTTPKNDHVPWRTPVFIDDEGTICAVGFLIQESVNKELPKKIAASHRYDFIEDIAKDLPEVEAWVEGSGFTLEEIASIQPAYSEPNSNTWRTWNLAKYRPKDGAYDKLDSRGTFKHGNMEGDWIAYQKPYDATEETIVGRGTMKHGSGAWTSFYNDGKKLGEGRYHDNRADGPWKLYHPSGNVAAEGSFDHGDRAGLWRFYYDTPDKTPIAIGKFNRGGDVIGRWKHFDDRGALLATSWTETPDQWHDTDWNVDGGEGFVLDIVAKPGEVKHVSHTGTVNSTSLALDMYALGGERIYVNSAYQSEVMYDQNGWKLIHADGVWRAADCEWSAKRVAYARRGDVVPLHGVLYNDARGRVHPKYEGVGGGEDSVDTGPACRAPVAVSTARAAKLDTLVAERDKVRALTPQFVRTAVLGEEDAAKTGDDMLDSEKRRLAAASDMTRVLASNMAMYLEWPHIDGKFEKLYGAMAGRVTWRWTDGDPEARTE